MEVWTDLYLEIAEIIKTKIPEIEWVDLWEDQVSYLTDELPFPTPAIFIGFQTNSCEDLAELIQSCDLQIDFYLFYESFSDTYQGSYNQDSAIEFLRLLTKIHKTFHGTSGLNFQPMRRVHVGKEESGGAGKLYRISFNCNSEDASAKAVFDETTLNELSITQAPPPPKETQNSLFSLP